MQACRARQSQIGTLRTSVGYRQGDDDEEDLVKGLLIAVGIVFVLYIMDQKFAQGRYTDAVQRMTIQMRHSFGV
jgi:hypothetical protein